MMWNLGDLGWLTSAKRREWGNWEWDDCENSYGSFFHSLVLAPVRWKLKNVERTPENPPWSELCDLRWRSLVEFLAVKNCANLWGIHRFHTQLWAISVCVSCFVAGRWWSSMTCGFFWAVQKHQEKGTWHCRKWNQVTVPKGTGWRKLETALCVEVIPLMVSFQVSLVGTWNITRV